MVDDSEKTKPNPRLGGSYGTAPFNTVPLGGLRGFYKIPASETEEGKERIRAYYEALGRFVDKFSRVEAAVTFTLRAYSRTTLEVAKVVFAGVRVDVGMSYIKHLAEMTKASEEMRADLDHIFQQLAIINSDRNSILHYGAISVAEGAGIVSDAIKAKGEPKVFPISNTLLDNMTDDLEKIATHLNYRHLGRVPPLGGFGKVALDDILQRPWRYKHPVLPKEPSKKAESQQKKGRGPKPPPPPQS